MSCSYSEGIGFEEGDDLDIFLNTTSIKACPKCGDPRVGLYAVTIGPRIFTLNSLYRCLSCSYNYCITLANRVELPSDEPPECGFFEGIINDQPPW